MSSDAGNVRTSNADDSGLRKVWLRARPFVLATMTIAIAAGIAPLLQRLPHANLSLLFMTAVLIVAFRHGLWPGVYASLLSFLIFNFFFTPPSMTLAVSEEGDVATLIFFLVMASLSGNLAARLRDALATSEAAVKRTMSLQNLTRRVAGAATMEQVMQALTDRLFDYFGHAVIATVSEEEDDDVIVASGEKLTSQFQTAWTKTYKPCAIIDGWVLLPFDTVRGRTGTVGINVNDLKQQEREDAEALIDQAAVALDRTLLVKDLEKAKFISEREKHRSALLSSVSHDLRTPLSSIIGATTSLIAYEPSLSEDDKSTLLQSVLDEAERLDRYIQNLLDMTRLGQGQLELQRDWEDVRDLLSAASRRLHLARRGIRIETEIAEDSEFVYVHADLVEQVFVNLLDNAARYSPQSSPILVKAQRHGSDVIIEVSDRGPGIPHPDRERVFDPFFRVHDRDRKQGTGLGLSICRGIIRAHGGEINAHATANGGALLRMRIPLPEGKPPGQDQ